MRSESFFRTGIDFTSDSELFRFLQNPDTAFEISVISRIAKEFREKFVFILTCGRAEIISFVKPPNEIIERALSLKIPSVKKYRYCIESSPTDFFVFMTGAESPLFGDPTLSKQVSVSLDASRLSGTLSPYFEKLVSTGIAFSKRIHTDYDMDVFDSAIIDKTEEIIGSGKKVLIVGSGFRARNIASALSKANSVTMAMRDPDKVFLIPGGVRAISYEERKEWVLSSDAVISSTSGLYYTFDVDDRALFEGKVLIDLSKPHDVPDDLNPIRLSDMDIELPERKRLMEKIREEAEEEGRKFCVAIKKSEASEEVSERAKRIASSSLMRLSSRIAKIPISEEDGISLRSDIYESVRKSVINDAMETLSKGLK